MSVIMDHTLDQSYVYKNTEIGLHRQIVHTKYQIALLVAMLKMILRPHDSNGVLVKSNSGLCTVDVI